VTTPGTPVGGALFTSPALAALAYWQGANMPDRALIFTRTAARLAGAVLFEHWHYARTDPCRLTLSRALERDTTGAKTESHTWTLARPVDRPGLDGTERVLVLGNVGAVLVRVEGEAPPRTFQTVRKSTVTTDGVTPFVVGTTRTSGPVRLRWGVSLSVEA
jgi:hypothetical protein